MTTTYSTKKLLVLQADGERPRHHSYASVVMFLVHSPMPLARGQQEGASGSDSLPPFPLTLRSVFPPLRRRHPGFLQMSAPGAALTRVPSPL